MVDDEEEDEDELEDETYVVDEDEDEELEEDKNVVDDEEEDEDVVEVITYDTLVNSLPETEYGKLPLLFIYFIYIVAFN